MCGATFRFCLHAAKADSQLAKSPACTRHATITHVERPRPWAQWTW